MKTENLSGKHVQTEQLMRFSVCWIDVRAMTGWHATAYQPAVTTRTCSRFNRLLKGSGSSLSRVNTLGFHFFNGFVDFSLHFLGIEAQEVTT